MSIKIYAVGRLILSFFFFFFFFEFQYWHSFIDLLKLLSLYIYTFKPFNIGTSHVICKCCLHSSSLCSFFNPTSTCSLLVEYDLRELPIKSEIQLIFFSEVKFNVMVDKITYVEYLRLRFFYFRPFASFFWYVLWIHSCLLMITKKKRNKVKVIKGSFYLRNM